MSRLEIDADVLVLGGGPAGTWAALAAARAGARVVLADKGYCGTSGPTASGGNNLWNVPPGPARERSVQARFEDGGRLSEPAWMYRVPEETHHRVDELAGAGYRFPSGDDGREVRTSLQGPEYMRRMRRRVHRAGVTILDHSPALELLTTGDGIVSGAAGLQRQNGYAPWSVRAGAVVVATGGCAFLSGSFGTNVDTGDGLLMAAEVEASFSGMEFSTAYALAPAWSGHSKGLMMQFATYYDADGRTLGDGGLRTRRRDGAPRRRPPRVRASGPSQARHPRGHAHVATELLSAAGQGRHRPVHAEVSRAGSPGGNGARNRRHPGRRHRLRQ
ncbi:succinate dehydrogenase/fumarate reductase flavoprotein subunit [Rhodococcus percolatus]|nr:succinate dehydrogenase/fumarate reductase flavoprotein subunit [Rhodococcus opacus]MBP2208429.1 succinate dehydrogenase/fumarate reductase flavoprotein subunit [Rhodococcus opacus]